MKKKTLKNQDEPMGNLTKIADFLPPPSELLPTERTVKITIAIDDRTLKFFRNAASRQGLKYQRMMREVLKGYARKYG